MRSQLVDDVAVATILATGFPSPNPSKPIDSMGGLKGHHAHASLATVAGLLRELDDKAKPCPWWDLAFQTRKGGRQLLIHNQYLIEFGGAGPRSGTFDAQATLISPMDKIPLPTSDIFSLLRDIMTSLCDWLDRLEVALKKHLTPKYAAYKWPPHSFIALPVGYPPGPTTLAADYFPLPMCDGSDPLRWTIRWHTGSRPVQSQG
jgi:hypothetical protein